MVVKALDCVIKRWLVERRFRSRRTSGKGSYNFYFPIVVRGASTGGGAAVGSYLEFYEFNQIVLGVSGRALTADCMCGTRVLTHTISTQYVQT